MKARGLLALSVLISVLAGSSSAQAAEETTHLFDATLSLTGDCSTSALDPVPDPGPCPGIPGVDHPTKALQYPKGVAVDPHGNRYVASFGPETAEPNQGRIDIFDPEGTFITEIPDANGPSALAVDSEGNLYVFERTPSQRIVRFVPIQYEPVTGDISYNPDPEIVLLGGGFGNERLAINPSNDHLFFDRSARILEFNSAAEGNELLTDEIGLGHLANKAGTGNSGALAIDAVNGRIYADHIVESAKSGSETVIEVFELAEPYSWLGTITGSATPAGLFAGGYSGTALAVDESTSHLFVGEYAAKRQIYEVEPDGGYVSTIDEPTISYLGRPQIAIDNGMSSPTHGYLFVPSGEGALSRSLAFAPVPPSTAPVVESVSVSGVTETEAILESIISPEGKPTSYRFEYTTEQTFENAENAGGGTVAAATEGVRVSAPLNGLQPGVTYRFRVVAENDGGEDEAEGTFATYPAPDDSVDCPNASLRTGASAGLPDCRAYELVTPADTNGHPPLDPALFGPAFGSPNSSAAGDSVPFRILGGSIPDLGGNGALNGSSYVARRGPTGWSSSNAGPSGVESSEGNPGSFSPDHGYSFWESAGEGSVEFEIGASYLRYPDGHSEPLGQGSLATEPQAQGLRISENGSHVIFYTPADHGKQARQLELDAPPDGTEAIYDRTPDGKTHVVSLLPENVTPVAGQNARFMGASLDGKGVAFDFKQETFPPTPPTPIYLRFDNTETFTAAPPGTTFEGIAEGGKRLFYLDSGDLYAFDAADESTSTFTESGTANGTGKGDVTVINISDDGTAAYVVSPTVLTNAPNPRGKVAHEGGWNLYLARKGSIDFVGELTKLDVESVELGEGVQSLALDRWASNLRAMEVNTDPSRSTPNGEVLVFESRADLTGYDSEGEPEIYRYDASDGMLDCLSCPPTLGGPEGGARLQSVNQTPLHDTQVPVSKYNIAQNLRGDGRRVFFESGAALVAADTDGVQDVYEWEDEGVGSCRTPGGCLYLISSGRSAQPNYLFGVSGSGDDVFIQTSDLLLPSEDPDETPSIYDARVNGGFASAESVGECLGEACQPAVKAPSIVTPASSLFQGAGNVKEESRRRCPKGKRLVKQGKKRRCVRPHRKHQRHHRRHDHKRGA